MTIEYDLPNHTEQDAATYKTAIDSSVEVAIEVGAQFYTRQTVPSSLAVVVGSGVNSSGTSKVPQEVAIEIADLTNPRIDIVEIDALAVASVVKGVPSATPVKPEATEGSYIVASVLVGAGVSEITNTQITDLRSIVSLGSGASASYTRTFTNSELTAGQITIQHDLNSFGVTYLVTDADGKRYDPEEVTIVDENSVLLTFSNTLIGTFRATVQGGAIDVTAINDLLDQLEVTTTGDDKGVSFKNQITVAGEIIAGTDSYPVPIAFHCDIANTSGTVITGATDVTEILQSDTLSVTGLFGGTTTGSYILVGSPITYEGAKVKYDTLGTVEPENIISEFYENDANGWQNVPIMGTNSDFPYEEHGWNISQSEAEQVFFGFNPLTRDLPETWETKIFNINGVDYEYKFARLRITAPITLDPIVQQIKLHANRIEMEFGGIFKYGKARTPIQLFAGLHNVIANGLIDPPDETVLYTTTASGKWVDNRFRNTSDDGFLVPVQRDFGLDTSVPLKLDISFYVNGANTGDVEFIFRSSQVSDGYVYDGTNISSDQTLIHTVATPSDLVRQTISVVIPISQLQSNSGILIEVSRPGATGANDTLGASIVIVNVLATGYAWKI